MGNISTTSQTLTISNAGDRVVTQGLITMSSSYAAGGDAATARQLGLGAVQILSISVSTSGFQLTPVGPPTAGTTFTIAAFKRADVAISAGTTASVQVRLAGIDTAGGTIISSASANLTFTGAAQVEATAATNLSTVTARFRAEGY